LLNMVDRSVKLISPCNANETWPLGYRIYDQANFSTAAELRTIIRQMIKKHMPLTLGLEEQIRFRPDLKYDKFDDAFHLSSLSMKYSLSSTPKLQEIVKLAFTKSLTAGEIALLLEAEKRIDLTETLHYLNEFFQQGFFE
jgi:hypothetical protein